MTAVDLSDTLDALPNQIDRLADQVETKAKQALEEAQGFRKATVQSINWTTKTLGLTVGGSTATQTGFSWASGYQPVVGDDVWCAEVGGNLLVLGKQGPHGGYEIVQATPFVDFHYNSDVSVDYNVRLINDVSNQLSILSADGSPLLYVVGGDVRAFNAQMGNGFYGSGYAHFGYYTKVGASGGYAMLQQSTGETFVNTNAGVLHLRDGNTDVQTLRISAGVSECVFPATLPALGGNTAIYVTTSKQLGYATSSSEFKRDIKTLTLKSGVANPVFSLKARTFKWVAEVADRSDPKAQGEVVGLIAEDVEQVAPEATWGEEGKPTGINNDAMIAYLVDAVNFLKDQNEVLQERVNVLEAQTK